MSEYPFGTRPDRIPEESWESLVVSQTAEQALEQSKLQPSIDVVGPNMGHFAILLVLTAALDFGAQFVSLLLVHALHLYGHHTVRAYAQIVQDDARWLVPTEALGYLLVLTAAVPVFRWLWQRGFAAGVHWNGRVALRGFGKFLAIGFGCGIGIGMLGNLLPMPKNPPIMADMMHSPAGAWMMLIFGITGAPLFEELFFRGFLLPAFLNAVRWLWIKDDLSTKAALWFGVPMAAVLTSLPFALLHAPQVSHAWGPVLLIGLVSLVLCYVRVYFQSLAASALVHAAYNSTLFFGILVETGGFRHLDRIVQ